MPGQRFGGAPRVGDDVHAERPRLHRDVTGEVAEADKSQRAAMQTPHGFTDRNMPVASPHRSIVSANLPPQREEQREDVFRNLVDAGVEDVRNDDSALRGAIYRDVVDALTMVE